MPGGIVWEGRGGGFVIRGVKRIRGVGPLIVGSLSLLHPVARATSMVASSASGQRVRPNRRIRPRLSHLRKGREPGGDGDIFLRQDRTQVEQDALALDSADHRRRPLAQSRRDRLR